MGVSVTLVTRQSEGASANIANSLQLTPALFFRPFTYETWLWMYEHQQNWTTVEWISCLHWTRAGYATKTERFTNNLLTREAKRFIYDDSVFDQFRRVDYRRYAGSWFLGSQHIRLASFGWSSRSKDSESEVWSILWSSTQDIHNYFLLYL